MNAICFFSILVCLFCKQKICRLPLWGRCLLAFAFAFTSLMTGCVDVARGIRASLYVTGAGTHTAAQGRDEANNPQPGNADANVTFDYHSKLKVTFAFAFPGLWAVCSNSPSTRRVTHVA